MFLFHKSSGKYYALCGFGGVLSCGLTHTLVTPLDLVKCRLQVNKEKYKSLGKLHIILLFDVVTSPSKNYHMTFF